MATQVLQEMAQAGKLHIPDPWVNDFGQTLVAWSEDEDGDALACYLDIFGLNGRDIKMSDSDSWRAKRLARARAQAPQG